MTNAYLNYKAIDTVLLSEIDIFQIMRDRILIFSCLV